MNRSLLLMVPLIPIAVMVSPRAEAGTTGVVRG